MPRFDLEAYVSVQERIVQFWQDHPAGRIVTRLESNPADWKTCRYVAEVYADREDTRPVATGWAFEIAGGGSANASSHEENCETSAIGRALANMGYATTQATRPSREEMDKVNRFAEQHHVERPPTAITAAPSAAQRALGKRVAGPAPRPCKWADVVGALKADGWQLTGTDAAAIAADISYFYEEEEIPSTNPQGGWWPSDIWAFVAAKNAEQPSAATE